MRFPIRVSLFLFLFILFSSISIGALVPDQVITSEEIQHAGLVRLTDLYSLMDDWNSYTIDGYSWHSSPGSNELMNNDWLLLVDGKKIFLESLDGKNLNHLPINVTTIDSVAIFSRPVFYNGHFSTDGIISIVTKKPGKGVTWDSNYNLGNETKDPGPYTFIEEKDTPNVDKIGPDYTNALSLSSGDNYIRAHLVEHGHFNTDPNIKYRMTDANSGVYPKMENEAYSADVLVNTKYSDISVFYYNTEHEDFYESHVNTFTIPVGNDLSEATFQMKSNASDKFSLSLDLNYSNDKLTDKPEYPESYPPIYDFNWDRTRVEGAITYGFYSEKSNFGLKSGLRQDKLEPEFSVVGDKNQILNMYTNTWVNYRFRNDVLSIGAKYYSVEEETGYNLFAQFDKPFTNKWLSSLSAVYSNTSVFEDPEFWVWRSRGWHNNYDLYQSSLDYNNEQEKRLDITFLNRIKLNKSFSLQVKAAYSDFSGYAFDYKREYDSIIEIPDPNSLPLDVPYRNHYLVRIDKQTFRINSKIKHQIFEFLKQELIYTHSAINKMDVSRRYDTNNRKDYTGYPHIPKHIVKYNLIYSSSNNFTAGLYLKWQSDSRWDYYRIIDTFDSIKLDPEAFFNMNIAISKGFWKNRARLSFMGQNLLGDEIYYHPLGAGVYDLTFWTKLDIHLNSADLLGR